VHKAAKISTILGAAIFLASATPSLAAITYNRTPGGTTPTSPLVVSVTADTALELGIDQDYWVLSFDTNSGEIDPIDTQGECLSSSTLSGTFHFSAPVGTEVRGVDEVSFSDSNCTAGRSGGNYVEGDGGSIIFTIAEAAAPSSGSIIPMPVNLTPALSAGISDQFGDNGTLLFLALALGLPLSFFIFHELLGLFPDVKRFRRKRGDEFFTK